MKTIRCLISILLMQIHQVGIPYVLITYSSETSVTMPCAPLIIFLNVLGFGAETGRGFQEPINLIINSIRLIPFKMTLIQGS